MELARGQMSNGLKYIISQLDGYYDIWFGDDFDKAEYTGCSTSGTMEQILKEFEGVLLCMQ